MVKVSKVTILKFLSDEEGSISVLIMGLFIVALTFVIVMTDISVVYLAKRNLTAISESAAQRGLGNIDEKSYYQGEFNLTQAAATAIGYGGEDPGIPIDCEKGETDVVDALNKYSHQGSSTKRANLTEISLDTFECDGFSIYIETSALIEMPIRLPFMNSGSVLVRSISGGLPERAFTNNYSGFDIG